MRIIGNKCPGNISIQTQNIQAPVAGELTTKKLVRNTHTGSLTKLITDTKIQKFEVYCVLFQGTEKKLHIEIMIKQTYGTYQQLD